MKDQLMYLMVNKHKFFKERLLSDSQLELYNFVKSRMVSNSNEVSHKFKISIQSASARLKVLHKKGYLFKESVQDPTGGYFNLYSDNLVKSPSKQVSEFIALGEDK